MINILFDHQIFTMQAYGGISRYFANINHYANKEDDLQTDITLLKTNNHYIRDFPAPLNNFIGDILLSKQRKLFRWNERYAAYRIKQGNFDILHPTYYNPYFLKDNKMPYVITVHDMIHELFPEYFDPGDIFVRYKRMCIENAAHIIAISSTTKEDLKQILGVHDSRISVIHHGSTAALVSVDEVAPRDGANYLLFVGERRGYKNFFKFISAVAPLLHKDLSLVIICAGGGAFQDAERETFSRLKITQQISQRGVSDLELRQLYKNAIAFIYPSLYEGFGLPILEAFQNGCPVIASDTPCFKEIGQNALAYFNPTDEHDILRTIETVMTSEAERQVMAARGKILLSNFAMEKCIDKTLSVYRNIAQKS